MDYYCEVCDKFIKPKIKYKHFKPNTYKEFNSCKHMKLTIENLDVKNVDEVSDAYIFQHSKECDCYLFNRQLKVVFNDNQYSE